MEALHLMRQRVIGKPGPRFAPTLQPALVAAALLCQSPARAVIGGPYTPDAATLHLWHLDETATPCLDAVTAGGLDLSSLTGGATLGNASVSGFGSALSAYDGGPNGIAPTDMDACLSALTPVSGTGDNVTMTYAGADGAFTYEALVRVDFDPAMNFGTTANGGNGRGKQMMIMTGEDDDPPTNRQFQFRINPKLTATDTVKLEFINIGTVTQTVAMPLPVTGPDAIRNGGWYHVAVAYNGSANTADNIKFYWTTLDPCRSRATLLGSNNMQNDLGAKTPDFTIGQTGRASPNANFLGLVDEVRMSNIARAATAFVFRPVMIAGASGSDANVPENTLDANFGTRWSAIGDGQWIAYDLGRSLLVSGVSISFYLGNTRTATFDVLVSTDNTNWQTVLSRTVSSGTTTDLEWFDFPDVTARYVRIVGHGNSVSTWNSLTEVVVGLADADDSDHDGLTDSWEQFHFGSLAQTAAGNPDSDGASNLGEFHSGTSPLVAQPTGDTDGDGLPDAWETQHFGNLAQTANGDFDRDGATNLTEYQDASNPANPNSVAGDLDGDNLPDAWETAAFGDLTNWAYDDFDGDGGDNLAEMVAGTSPKDAAEHPARMAPRVALLGDSVLSSSALLMPTGSAYGRAINGVSFQTDILLTCNGRQYTGWYEHLGTSQTVWLARRTINGTTAGPWEAVNTGSLFTNGKPSWDAHNNISLGISPRDGTLHLSWDHHGNTLRYRRSVTGLCTTNTAAWGPAMMNPEQNWLVASGQTVTSLTYPNFITSPAGDLIFEYRYGGSGNGDSGMQAYDPATGNWKARSQFLLRSGTFTGISQNNTVISSTSRNAYENGFDFAPDGTLHYTWTFREGNGAFNHDIDYAYSTDGGATWRNNAGTVVADKNASQSITVASPGIVMKAIEGTQQLINTQAQCVDLDGRVHVVMYHRRVEPGFAWQSGDGTFFGPDVAYYHYFRDPVTRAWSQRRLPVDPPAGSRPKIAFDKHANVYVVYNPGAIYTSGGSLVVTSASKASGYTDWTVVATINGNFNGEPLVDQDRLTADGILSVYLQEDGPSSASPVGTPLHVLDFVVDVPPPAPTSLMLLGSDVVVCRQTQTGSVYQLQASPDLTAASWTNLGSAVNGTGGVLALPHPGGANAPRQFYRVVVTP